MSELKFIPSLLFLAEEKRSVALENISGWLEPELEVITCGVISVCCWCSKKQMRCGCSP